MSVAVPSAAGLRGPRLLDASLETVDRIERFSVLALPARASWELPGWLCLADDGGHVGRVNSATPVPLPSAGSTAGSAGPSTRGSDAGPDDAPAVVTATVREVAASYADRGLEPLIRWTPRAPAATAAQLAEAGWSSRGEVLVMTRALTDADAVRPDGIVLTAEATDGWRSTYLAAYDEEEGEVRLRLALAAPERKRFATSSSDGRTVGVGLGLDLDGLLGIFDVLTAPAFRRRGVARRIMLALLGWGGSAGADLAFLQVASANRAAVELYERLGFSVAYTYLYAGPSAPANG